MYPLDVSVVNQGGGLAPIKPGQKHNYADVLNFAQKKRKKIKEFRLGEIVHGKIIDLLADNEAVIELPIGTLSAQLHSRLKENDVLYLRVMQNEPQLLLTVYGVSSKSDGKRIDIADVLRMLDLPETEFFYVLAEYLSNKRSIITKEEIVAIEMDFNQLPEELTRKKNLQQAFQAIIFIREHKLPENKGVFKKLYPYFIEISKFKSLLLELENSLHEFEPAIEAKLQYVFSLINNPNSTFENLMWVFSIDFTDNSVKPSLFNILNSYKDNKAIFGKAAYISTLTQTILEVIEAQNFINLFALNGNNPFHYYLPIPVHGNSFEIIELKLKKATSNTPNNVSADISVNAQNSTENILKIELLENILNLRFLAETEQTEYLKANQLKLKNSLISMDYVVQSLTFEDNKEFIISESPENMPSSSVNFSVVV